MEGTDPDSRTHRFGGDWTTHKLKVLQKYLAAYTTALQRKPTADRPFKKAYIDAFAGTGYRTQREDEPLIEAESLFPADTAPAPQELLDGSARIALRVEPRFDKYVFVEKSPERCFQLEKLRLEFPALAKDILVQPGDSNTVIQALCDKDWRSHRAVLFLDPYGMQVDWQTIEAVAATRAIDLWVLFPLGVAVNRLVTRSGSISISWQKKLDSFLGTTTWRDVFYRTESTMTLFGPEERVVKVPPEAIGAFFVDRLRSVFPGVAPKPAVLYNSTLNPLYLLCFAAANPKGARTAVKIANDLLRDLR